MDYLTNQLEKYNKEQKASTDTKEANEIMDKYNVFQLKEDISCARERVSTDDSLLS